ncbi:hypothetical protein B9Z19DRAFT_1128382 [Tuber borchii]|uniref:Uncharacterized protein n=1 Tax=Tuber borchii TaxID=42251 RepID=A0A2T6ZPI1_TUBBO|nr:hypothetical protein B9Z19DRAFT_1128382 [Tuber borchii]
MSPKSDLIKSRITLYKHRKLIVEARIDQKVDEHERMLSQVDYSKEYEAVFDEQLTRTLKPMWDELLALGENIEELEAESKELEALEALEVSEASEGKETSEASKGKETSEASEGKETSKALEGEES